MAPDTLADQARGALVDELESSAAGAVEGGPPDLRGRLSRLALDGLYELVCVLAPDGRVLDVNARALEATGLTPELLVGRPLWEARSWAAAPEESGRLARAVSRAAAGEFVRWEAELLAGAAGKEVVTLDCSLRPVRCAGGAVAFLVAEGRDVSEMRRAREQVEGELADHAEDVERLAEELGRRKRELETALDAMRFAREQADRASAQKTSLLRMVSHELRSPLAALMLQLDRLRRDASELSPAHRSVVEKIRSAAYRLAGLVDSLLEYTRLESGRVTIVPARFDPAEIAADVIDELLSTAQGKHLALAGPPVGSAPHIETDPRLLRLILLNLVQNGIKFTDSGSVTVEIEASDGEHHISVRDTGRGISPEDQARIFEPFEQLEALAQKHTPGIGLGLALVREMVSALGGMITVASRPREGSTFTVTLPSRRRIAGREAEVIPVVPH